MAPSVGRPPSIRYAATGAWVTPSVQVRQAYLGRTVTITRSCAGIDEDQRTVRGTVRPRRVQPLGAVVTPKACFQPDADLVHLPAATGAFQAVGLNHLLDARQVFRQVAAIAFGRPFVLGLIGGRRCLVLLFLCLGDGNGEILEGPLPVVLVELLGLLAMHHMVQLRHQMLKAFVDLFKRGHMRGCRLQSLECRAVIGR